MIYMEELKEEDEFEQEQEYFSITHLENIFKAQQNNLYYYARDYKNQKDK